MFTGTCLAGDLGLVGSFVFERPSVGLSLGSFHSSDTTVLMTGKMS